MLSCKTQRRQPRRCPSGQLYDRKTRTCKPGIGRLKRGDLTKHGYSTSLPKKEREQALEKAVAEYGRLSIIRKLNAIYVLNKRRNPKVSHIAKQDRCTIQQVAK